MRRIVSFLLATLMLTAPAAQAVGELKSEVVTLDVRPGVTMRYLAVTGEEQPKAVVILFTGGKGTLHLGPSGELDKDLGLNFLIRTREEFVRQGLYVVAVDTASDNPDGMNGLVRHSSTYAQDIDKVIRDVMKHTSAPLWLVGTSAGTMSVANVAVRLGQSPSRPHGLIFTSTLTTLVSGLCGKSVYDAPLAAIQGPVLVVAHAEDACPCSPGNPAVVDKLLNAFSKAAPKDKMIFNGGDPPLSTACNARSRHGYFGIETEVVKSIADWIKSH